METRFFGSTPLKVTPIGLGLAALGRPGYINLGHAEDLNHSYNADEMEQHAHQVLDAAWQAGVRYFDAARSYGRAEAFLGSWLNSRKIPLDEVTVGSKWGYTYTAGWQVDAEVHEVKEHTLEVLKRQRLESDGHLGPYLKIYQVHSATLDSGILENQAVLDELRRYRDVGLVIGLTLSGAKQAETLKKALHVQANGQLLFTSVQATWNLLEPSIGPVLQQAKDEGMGVIIKEALANGRLTGRNDEPSFQPKMHVLKTAAHELGTTVDALALAAVLAQPWLDIVLSGAATQEQLRSNIKALDVAWSETVAERLFGLAESPEAYWDTRSSLEWN